MWNDVCIVVLLILACVTPYYFCADHASISPTARATGYEKEIALYEELVTRHSFSWYVDVFLALAISILSCVLIAVSSGPVFALRIFPAASWLSLGIYGYANRYFLHHNLNQYKPILPEGTIDTPALKLLTKNKP